MLRVVAHSMALRVSSSSTFSARAFDQSEIWFEHSSHQVINRLLEQVCYCNGLTILVTRKVCYCKGVPSICSVVCVTDIAAEGFIGKVNKVCRHMCALLGLPHLSCGYAPRAHAARGGSSRRRQAVQRCLFLLPFLTDCS